MKSVVDIQIADCLEGSVEKTIMFVEILLLDFNI